MKKLITFINIILLFLFSINIVIASNSMTLLSVTYDDKIIEGRTALLNLDVELGNGRVFIDTFPLTKMDTQISTRFANAIACDYIRTDCSKVDFFYSIRSDSPMLGGPSAGAAIAILTISKIEKISLDKHTAITGTINSGGMIGPVGGIKEKIDSASRNGIKKILIPIQTSLYEIDNKTIDLIDYGDSLGVKVIEVKDLNQAVYEFSGKILKRNFGPIKKSEIYKEVMTNIRKDICDRAFSYEFSNKYNLSNAYNLTSKAKNAINIGNDYSAASYCFGANIRFKELSLKNLSNKEVDFRLNLIENNLKLEFEELLNQSVESIIDLQAYMIVRERLLETKEHINSAKELMNLNKSPFYQIAYAEERFSSAKLWSKFFGHNGKEKNFKEKLLNSCVRKIGEAQERQQYVKLFSNVELNSLEESLLQAIKDLNNKEYALCLFKASKSKAEADVIISAMSSSNLNQLIERKLTASENIISRYQKEDSFPILGYSYYEYANMLKEDDPMSALLYSEYALEMSNLDIYFGNKGKLFFIFSWKKAFFNSSLLILGMLIGAYIAIKTLGRLQKESSSGKKR